MDEESKLSLQLNRSRLTDDLDVECVFDFLIQESVLSKDDIEAIKLGGISSKKVGLLLDILPQKGPHAFDKFVAALEKVGPGYEHLVTSLKNVQRNPRRRRHLSESQVQARLIEGAVPQRPRVYAERPEILTQVRSRLEGLTQSPGWVVIHGMSGIGKSVLAAESVRDARVLSEYFPGGVFWISIGQIDPLTDPQMMLVKMQSLLARLDKQGKISPRCLEEATDRLRTVFTQQYPRSLLILDDIWFSSALKLFDIQCRVLVTTRDAGVADRVLGDVFKVPVLEGFTSDQTKSVLAVWTETDVNKLPDDVNKIFLEVKGSPFAISMIGALLRDHPKRWNYYANLLAKKEVRKIRRAMSYQYETLTEAVGMSFNNLADEAKNYYQDFAVFQGDVKIPAQVLCVLWSEDMETIEDIMINLVNKSMAFQEPAPVKSSSNYVYYLHDLHLDFLREQCGDLKGLHENLIRKYRDNCQGQYYNLPDDGYIHWYIGDHLNKAGMFEEMGKIFFDLRFVAAKRNVTGLSNLISDYTQLGSVLKIVEPKFHKDFSKFLAQLSLERSHDIIQCALLQDEKSEVYSQAKYLSSNKDKPLDKVLRCCSAPSNTDTITIGDRMFMCAPSDLEVQGPIGTSPSSIVSKVKHLPSGCVIAVKKINASGDIQSQKKLLKDLDVSMRSASCPHTVQFYGALFHEGEVNICMEIMDTSLEEFYKRVFDKGMTIPEKVLGKMAYTVIEALDYLQSELNVVHRDVKPSNILLNREGLIKLCDFGISSHLVDSVSKTLDGGCKPYMAPERINPAVYMKYYDVRSDIWSLGISMIEVAAGIHPYSGYTNTYKQVTSVVENSPPTLPSGKFTAEFEDFIACCLQKDHKKRPKYAKLKQHPFITMYMDEDVDMGKYVCSILGDS